MHIQRTTQVFVEAYMRIEGNTIIFKSTPENFHKEKVGLKTCTIRRIVLWSEMKEFEEILILWNSGYNMKIKITNTVGSDSFERILTDITQFEGLWVFSWRSE